MYDRRRPQRSTSLREQVVELGRRVGSSARCGPGRAGRSCSRARRASGSARRRAAAAIGPPSASPAAISSIVAQLLAHGGGVAAGRERGEQRLVEVRAGAEEAQRAAEEHDAGVDRLAALDARDDPQRGVLERATRGHARPPRPTSRGASSRRVRNSRVRGRRRPTRPGRALRAGAGSARGARRASAAAIEPAAGSSTWSRIAGKPPRARASGSAPWNAYRAAPWSISHRLPCQRSRFGLRGVRSTFVTSASSHTTSAASVRVRRLRSGCRAASRAGSRRRG